jgi:hypothetical protein
MLRLETEAFKGFLFIPAIRYAFCRASIAEVLDPI